MLTERFRLQYPRPEGQVEASPYVVDIDGGGRFLVDRLIARRQNQTLLEAEDGLYHTFLANLAPHRDRVTPVRGPSETLLDKLAVTGLEPDIVYIDADKKRSDLDDCFRLWPRAQLTGDDYLWQPERGYPMQQHVHAFAAERGYSVRHVLHTWVLVPPAGMS